MRENSGTQSTSGDTGNKRINRNQEKSKHRGQGEGRQHKGDKAEGARGTEGSCSEGQRQRTGWREQDEGAENQVRTREEQGVWAHLWGKEPQR
jgi:hypothetical protein